MKLSEAAKAYFRLLLPSTPADDDGIHRFTVEPCDKRRFPGLRGAKAVLFWWSEEGGKLAPVWVAE